MSNLGDSNTPIEGESFGLPAGAELTEDANGNLAIADSGGSIVLVRDETAGEWQFENTDLTGINAIDASSATLDDASVANSPTENNDVVRKTETDAIQSDVDTKVDQTDFDDHSARHEDGGADELNVSGLSGDLADQQQPTDHAHDGTADSGGASLNPEATTLQDTQEPTTDGEIRRSGSDVFVHTNGNSRSVSDFLTASQVETFWTEDANSPHNLSTDGTTYTLNSNFDVIRVNFKTNVNSGFDFRVYFNGNQTDEYRYRDNGDTETTTTDGIRLCDYGAAQGHMLIQGRFEIKPGLWSFVRDNNADALFGNGSALMSSPINTISWTESEDCDIEVYGRDLA